jgi:hypothetical protein
MDVFEQQGLHGSEVSALKAVFIPGVMHFGWRDLTRGRRLLEQNRSSTVDSDHENHLASVTLTGTLDM